MEVGLQIQQTLITIVGYTHVTVTAGPSPVLEKCRSWWPRYFSETTLDPTFACALPSLSSMVASSDALFSISSSRRTILLVYIFIVGSAKVAKFCERSDEASPKKSNHCINFSTIHSSVSKGLFSDPIITHYHQLSSNITNVCFYVVKKRPPTTPNDP